MGNTLEELKRENQRLKNRVQSQREIEEIGRERQRLMQENMELRNPKTTAFKKNILRGLKSGGKVTMGFLDSITKPKNNKQNIIKPKRVKKQKEFGMNDLIY
jgi:hypothetical protein